MPTLHNSHEQLLQPRKQIIRIGCSRVSPIPVGRLSPLGRSDIDAAHFRADHRGAGVMFRAGIDDAGALGDWIQEHLAVQLASQDAAFHLGADVCEFCGVAVVVVCRQVCLDVFPAAVVVDRARGIEGSVVINTYLVRIWWMTYFVVL